MAAAVTRAQAGPAAGPATGAGRVVDALVAAGVRHLFSLSGNQILSIYDATIGRGLDIVHTRHEAAAVHMAVSLDWDFDVEDVRCSVTWWHEFKRQIRRMPGEHHGAAAVSVYGFTDFHLKNAIALTRLRTEFKGKVEIIQFPAPVLRDLKKLAAEVVREESEKTPMARKVHASFAKFQALVGPWDHVAEGAYHQFVAG